MSPGKAQRKGITFMELLKGTSKNFSSPHGQICRPIDALSGTGFLIVRGGETRGVTLFFRGALKMFPDHATAQAWFAETRWPGGAHCGSANLKTGAQHHSMPYRCREQGCAKRFSTKTGTVMECSNLGFQLWAVALFLVATNLKGISSTKLHRDLGVTQQTAWLPGFNPFDGPIEADETCVGGQRKNRFHEKRKQLRGTGTVGKVVVAGVKDPATGQVSARVVQGMDSVTRQGFVRHHATPGTIIYTDEAPADRGMTSFEHQAVHHGVGEYVRDRTHTNGIESF